MFVPRWVHATCQGLSCEDEVEAVADEGFDCSLCRGHGCSSYGEVTEVTGFLLTPSDHRSYLLVLDLRYTIDII